MTEPATPDTDLAAQLEAALTAAQSPLSLAPDDSVDLIGDELAFHDARFDELLIIRTSRLESLLTNQSISHVVAGLENLSAAFVVADEVESATWDSNQPVHAAGDGFVATALTQGHVSLYSVEDELSVAVPVQAVALDPRDRIATSAMAALSSEIDRATGTTLGDRVEMDTPVGRPLRDGTLTAFATDDPFSPGDPFTSPTEEPAAAAGESVTSAGPEVEPGYSPGM